MGDQSIQEASMFSNVFSLAVVIGLGGFVVFLCSVALNNLTLAYPSLLVSLLAFFTAFALRRPSNPPLGE